MILEGQISISQCEHFNLYVKENTGGGQVKFYFADANSKIKFYKNKNLKFLADWTGNFETNKMINTTIKPRDNLTKNMKMKLYS